MTFNANRRCTQYNKIASPELGAKLLWPIHVMIVSHSADPSKQQRKPPFYVPRLQIALHVARFDALLFARRSHITVNLLLP